MPREAKFTCMTGDCAEKMNKIPSGDAQLVFADPPYNIDYKAYDKYDDKRDTASYLVWMSEWMQQIHRVLHRTGSFWLAINDEYVAEAKLIATQSPLLDYRAFDSGAGRGLGLLRSFPSFYLRSHVIWYYTFGVAAQNNFSRSHTHLLYFTKHKTDFYFDNKAIRVPSQRELVYGDKRAKKGGKMPDNTWVLTKDELAKSFGPDEDTWLVPRVCGSFKERQVRGTQKKKVGNKVVRELGLPQMPEAILDRIVASCTQPGDVVVDPFLGTATTGVSAVRYGCEFWGCDISSAYVTQGRKRIKAVVPLK